MRGKYSLVGIRIHLQEHPEDTEEFLQKARGGLEAIKDSPLRRLWEENEDEFFYNFDQDVMKIFCMPKSDR